MFFLALCLAPLCGALLLAPRRAPRRGVVTFSEAEDWPSDTGDGDGVSDWDMPSADAASDEASRGVVKARLYAACAACDRGFAASARDRERVEMMLEELALLSPTADATAGLASGEFDAPLRKCWRLVYTSAADVSTLGGNPLVSVGAIYQDARELPVIVNVIDTFPRLLSLAPPQLGARLDSSTRQKVFTRARARSSTRVGLAFEALEIAPLRLLGMEVPELPFKLRLDLPQLGLDLQRRLFGVADDKDPRDESPAYFDVKYLDADFLVIKQAQPGGYFAAIAVEDLD